MISVMKKPHMRVSHRVRSNETPINLPVSRAQRTFCPSRRRKTYYRTWSGGNRRLDREQVSPPAAIPRDSRWSPEALPTTVSDSAILDTTQKTLQFRSSPRSPAFQFLQSVDI
jgi:hypothetical protein